MIARNGVPAAGRSSRTTAGTWLFVCTAVFARSRGHAWQSHALAANGLGICRSGLVGSFAKGGIGGWRTCGRRDVA
jgi:hypothetical protein